MRADICKAGLKIIALQVRLGWEHTEGRGGGFLAQDRREERGAFSPTEEPVQTS